MDDQHTTRRNFNRELAAISEAERWLKAVAEKAGLPESTVFAMQVCLEELLSNIVRHGAPPGLSGSQVEIAIDTGGYRARMMIEEQGAAFDVTEAPAVPITRPLEEVQPGGLGIPLIKSFSSNLTYRRIGDRNCVTMEFSK